MLRISALSVALALFTCDALSAELVTAPTQPTEAKITSMTAAAPAETKIASQAEDPAAHDLVLATWGLLGVTLILACATVWVGWKQSDDLKQRERSAMMRELNRNAHKVAATAERLQPLARQVPTASSQLRILAGHGGLPPDRKAALEVDLNARRTRLEEIKTNALGVIVEPNSRISAEELTRHLWRLDEHAVQLDAMRDAITEELSRCESQSREHRERNAAMEAARLGAALQNH